MSDADALKALFASFSRIQVRNYTNVACFVYLILEYFETLESEVKYVWGYKLSAVNMMFFGARYLGFINIPILLFIECGLSISAQSCKTLYATILMLMAVSTTCSDAIAYMRVHALANRSRAMSLYLPVHFCVVYIAFYIAFTIDITKSEFAPSPYSDRISCFPSVGNRTRMFVPFFILLFSTTSACILSLFFATRNYYHTNSPFMRIFYIDGTFSFIVMAAVTTGKAILHLAAPPEYLLLLAAAHQTVHSTLSARLLLRMRETARKDDTTIDNGQLTAIYFAAALDTVECGHEEGATAKQYNSESSSDVTELSRSCWKNGMTETATLSDRKAEPGR